MPITKLSAGSLEYVLVRVAARQAGDLVDLSGTTVRMAFVTAATEPVSGDWKAASWDTDPGPPATYRARCLVGPGGTVTLAAGTYHVWVEVTDAPEIPKRDAGLIEVT